MMGYQQVRVLILLRYQQELVTMHQLERDSLAKNANPIKCCML